MREIDTDALQAVAAALGVGNPITATGEAIFDDANLQQVLDVSDLIARGRVKPFDVGLGVYTLQTDHAGAGQQTDSTSVFNTNLSQYFAPWPAEDIIAGKFDLWYVGHSAVSTGTQSLLTAAALNMTFNNMPGLYTAVQTPGSITFKPIGYYTLENPFGYMMGPSAIPVFTDRPFRIARSGSPDTTFSWTSTATGAGAQYRCDIHVAITPAGLRPNAF